MGLEDTGSLKQQSLRTQEFQFLMKNFKNEEKIKQVIETLEFVARRWDWLEKEQKSETEKAEWSFWVQKDDMRKAWKMPGPKLPGSSPHRPLALQCQPLRCGKEVRHCVFFWWLVVAARVASLGLLGDILLIGNRRQSISLTDDSSFSEACSDSLTGTIWSRSIA